MTFGHNRRRALVVGAHGVIGRSLINHLDQVGDWDVVGVSRRGGEPRGSVRYVSVDLLDAEAARQALSAVPGITHVFYAAYQERATWAELVEPNVTMLANAVEGAQNPALEHVQLMQGYKVYGAHLGPFKTPAREDDPPHMPPEFNLDQQSLLEALSAERGWTWSALRPAVVAGVAFGTPMNLVNVLALYGTFARELGVPLRFPGRRGAYDALLEITDAGLLARAAAWAATDPRAAGEAFNVGNGDLIRWRETWPIIADYFGVEPAPPLPMSLVEVMADKEPLWDDLVGRHDLEPHSYAELSSWAFGDGVFAWDYDMFGDASKLRRFGFHEYVDTNKMFPAAFDELRRRRVIP